jgi:hypothetical protein
VLTDDGGFAASGVVEDPTTKCGHPAWYIRIGWYLVGIDPDAVRASSGTCQTIKAQL